MPLRLQVWLEASRPKTLAAAVVPVAVATAFAFGHAAAHWSKAALCLAFALLVQIGTNFANDYFDYRSGADAANRVGPRRAVAAGLVTPRAMRWATGLVLAAAFGVGLFLVTDGNWVLLPVGIASIACAIAYTGGPFPLGYNGLGDVFVFIFFGLVAVGVTFYVQAGFVTGAVWLSGAAIGLLAANILVANNYRDAETDAAAGKRTLVVRFGRRFAVWQYGVSAGFALSSGGWLYFSTGYGWLVLLPMGLLPWALRLTLRLARSNDAREQIALLGASARLLFFFGILLGIGAAFGRS
ncbi:MAG: 1,4-dihydroxy-2-naphthoate polyprenyltransferase [Candidatus Didemnitutus sp.]|nr:1,4-dihydroxy-2-naphthoate polyprenyltransferase [Candidatus Didemnitutus sp.]